MTKKKGEWIGYSYAWIEDQSDALLVAASGRDQVFVIDDAEVTREQLWRYPSRTECMACHTRAAGFVLGLTTEQMNKVHDFGDGVKVNQLEALETLGVLKTNSLPKAKDGLRTDLQFLGNLDHRHVRTPQLEDNGPALRRRLDTGGVWPGLAWRVVL